MPRLSSCTSLIEGALDVTTSRALDHMQVDLSNNIVSASSTIRGRVLLVACGGSSIAHYEEVLLAAGYHTTVLSVLTARHLARHSNCDLILAVLGACPTNS